MEEGLNSFFKNSIQKRQFVRVILEKGRGKNKKEKKKDYCLNEGLHY